MRWLTVTFLVVAMFGSTVQADSIALTNAGFEDPVLPEAPGNLVIISVPSTAYGWEFIWGQNDYIINPSASDPTVGTAASEGNNHLGFSNWQYPDPFSPLIVRQILDTSYAPNTKYTLSVDVGHYTEGNYAGYAFGLAADGVWGCAIGDHTFNIDPSSNLSTVLETGASPTAGNWMTVSTSFTTGAEGGLVGQNIRILLWSGDLGGYKTGFDNVRLDAQSIPEPSTLILAGLGLASLLVYGWRKRK